MPTLLHINKAIRTYGCRNYLTGIRNRYRKKLCSLESFVLGAAEAYLIAEKPRRALAQLALLDHSGLCSVTAGRVREMQRNAESLMTNEKPTCSLNMIVKNEQDNIDAALGSVDDTMDEIVVCDTGSTDSTVEEALLFGATVIHDPWNNDFSHPRNAAIDASTCEWILWMDADDRMERSCIEGLVSLWQTGSPHGAAFRVVNRIHGGPPVEFLQVRLFPRMAGVRFERRIHEQIMFSAQRAGLTFSNHAGIRIIHTGYPDPETQRKKALRNQALVATELAATPKDASLRLSYADGQVALGDLSGALDYYVDLCNDNEAYRQNSDVFVQAHVNAAAVSMKRGELREAKRYFYRSLYLDNQRAESFYSLGRIFANEGDKDRALDLYLAAAKAKPPVRMTAVANAKVRFDALYCMAEILLEREEHAQVQHILSAALRDYPMIPAYHNQLGRSCLAQIRLKEAAQHFAQSLSLCTTNNDDAYIGMADLYTTIGDPKSALDYLYRAIDIGVRAEKIAVRIGSAKRALKQMEPSSLLEISL